MKAFLDFNFNLNMKHQKQSGRAMQKPAPPSNSSIFSANKK